MQPPIRQQPAPARWLRSGAPLDVPQFIQDEMNRDPQATADKIAAELCKRRIGMPATVVAAWMQKFQSADSVAAS